MRAVLVSIGPSWPAPLAALLREHGVEVTTCADVFDAIEAVRHGGVGAAIIHGELGDADVALAVRGFARAESPTQIAVAGAATAPDDVTLFSDPWSYVEMRDWVLSMRGAPIDVGLLAPPTTMDADGVRERLRVARHEPYHALLGLTERASSDEVSAQAAAWQAALTPDRLPAEIREGMAGELRELRAALRDAQQVLSSPELRSRYEAGRTRDA